MNKTSRLALIACLLVAAAALVTVSMFAGQPARAVSPAVRTDYILAPGIQLVPLGSGQPNSLLRREAYKALWAGIYRRDDLGWMATAANDGATLYPAGTVVGGIAGDLFPAQCSAVHGGALVFAAAAARGRAQ